MSAPSENMPMAAAAPARKTAAGCGTCRISSARPLSWRLPRTMQFDGYIHNILMQATTFAIAVFGLSVVLGLCGQINLAQAAFFGLGAYAVGIGTSDYHVSYWLCLAGGCVIALLAGAFLGMSTLRLGGHYLAMVTISFQQIVTLVMINSIWLTHGPDGVSQHRPARAVSILAVLSGVLRRHAGAGRLCRLASAGYEAWPRDARGARQ